jgi:hypothetical protein
MVSEFCLFEYKLQYDLEPHCSVPHIPFNTTV